MIKNMKVGTKLLTAFFIMVLILVSSGIISVIFTDIVGGKGIEVGEKLAPLGDAAMEIKLTATQGHLIFEEIMGGDTNENIDEVWKLLDETIWYMDAILKGGKNDEGRFFPSEDPKVKAKINEARVEFLKFKTIAQQRHSQKDNDSIGIEADQKFDKAFETFIALADEAEELIHDDMVTGLNELKEKRNTAKMVVIIFCLAAILLAILLGTVITRSIARPLNESVQFAEQVAQGNLSAIINVRQNDEIGLLTVSLETMAKQLREMIERIKNGASEINNYSEHVVVGGTELSMRTNEQAASLTQTSTTVEEFTAILKSSNENAEEANSTLDAFNTEIQAKKELITNVTSTMAEINDSSQKIDSIVNVINDISFQTNLLALNAAVEAARAGEAGRGFAVVAAEVRNLAQKTAESSKTIREIVTQNVDSTQKGMELIQQTSEFFESIMKTTQHLSEQIQHIAAGSNEQSTGIDQINEAVMQLDGVVTQNASLVEEFEAAGRSLKSGANELVELISHFKIDENESRPTPKAKAEPKKKSPVNQAPASKKTKPPKEASPKSEPKPAPPSQKEQDSADDFFSADEDGFQEF
jgi:methyl-accepting chemotaxis protein